MRRLLTFLVLITSTFAVAERVVTVTGGMTATSPFTVSATGASPQTITHSYIYVDGILVAHAAGKTISAKIAAPPGNHRISFTFTQSSGEQLRSTMYVNVLGSQVSHAVTLNWNASASSSVTGYRVYRGTASGGPYTRITGAPLSVLTYEDNTVTSGQTYHYVVTAVASNGTESNFSGEAAAVIP